MQGTAAVIGLRLAGFADLAFGSAAADAGLDGDGKQDRSNPCLGVIAFTAAPGRHGAIAAKRRRSSSPARTLLSRPESAGMREMKMGVMDARLPAFVRHLFPAFVGLPLGPMLTLSVRALARRRPTLFERLGEHRRERYFIDPVDLAFAFVVVPDGERTVVRVTHRSGASACGVVIRGPLLALLALLDGTFDGDALFFNRIILISGRTEAVLALRNAIEDAELRPADLLGVSGVLAQLVDAGTLGGLDMARRLAASPPARPEP